MNTLYSGFIQKYLDILSFRDFAPKTISAYISYLDEFLCWTEKELSGKPLSDVSYEEIRSYLRYLKDIRKLNNRTINVHIAQLRDFSSMSSTGTGTVIRFLISTTTSSFPRCLP